MLTHETGYALNVRRYATHGKIPKTMPAAASQPQVLGGTKHLSALLGGTKHLSVLLGGTKHLSARGARRVALTAEQLHRQLRTNPRPDVWASTEARVKLPDGKINKLINK